MYIFVMGSGVLRVRDWLGLLKELVREEFFAVVVLVLLPVPRTKRTCSSFAPEMLPSVRNHLFAMINTAQFLHSLSRFMRTSSHRPASGYHSRPPHAVRHQLLI